MYDTTLKWCDLNQVPLNGPKKHYCIFINPAFIVSFMYNGDAIYFNLYKPKNICIPRKKSKTQYLGMEWVQMDASSEYFISKWTWTMTMTVWRKEDEHKSYLSMVST